MAKKSLCPPGILRGHEIDLAKDTECANTDILYVPDRKTDDIQGTARLHFLTLFSAHRYNFHLQKTGFFSGILRG